jgi:hypothetical protein
LIVTLQVIENQIYKQGKTTKNEKKQGKTKINKREAKKGRGRGFLHPLHLLLDKSHTINQIEIKVK